MDCDQDHRKDLFGKMASLIKKTVKFLFIYILSSQYNLYNILPGEGYSKNALCSLKLISTFVLLYLVPESIIRPIVNAEAQTSF